MHNPWYLGGAGPVAAEQVSKPSIHCALQLDLEGNAIGSGTGY